MGQTFSQLTNPGSALINPGGGVAAMGDPSKMRDLDFRMNSQKHPYLPGTPDPNTPTPTAQTPSFQQAASYGATPGGGNALSPGLTKGGKLATLLMSGLQGALAGRAKSEETVAATGGRRSGGAGMGFEAGYTLPWQRAGQQNQLAQQRAQTGVLQSEAQNINLPGVGPVPGWLAKTLGPAGLRAQGALGVQQMKGDTAESVQGQKSQTALGVAGINQRYKVVPNVGLFDTQTRQLVPQTEQGITITPDIAKDHNLPQEFIGKPMSLQQLASVQRSDVFQTVPVQGASGPALVNRKTAQVTPLNLGSPGVATAQARAVQVAADPNNPGAVTYQPAGQAMKTGAAAPASANTQAARTEARSEVPTQIGNQKVAFNTALQHADLLQQALTALSNGDVRGINALKNRFKTEFGSADVTNFQVIANAYTREVTKMLSSGHITDAEIGTQGATLPANASPQQILGALSSYRALAQSKLNMLNQQANSAKTGGSAKAAPTGGEHPFFSQFGGQARQSPNQP